MYTELDRIARAWQPGGLTRFRPAEGARPRRGDWHRIDPHPVATGGPTAGGWMLIALLLALIAVAALAGSAG